MYRWVDHTAELELAIEAESQAAVFADALAAVAELLGESGAALGEEGRPGPIAEAGREARREVELASVDRAALLADWVDELVYLAEVDGFVPARLLELELGQGWLRATVAGWLGEPRPLVKAVTRHRLAFEPVGGRWRARLVLDV